MLIRFDPGKGEMTMLSIPRDLKVENIPGHGGPYKINAAYSFGGAKLGLRVIEQVLGPSVQINHVIDTDFRGFRQAVDAIGGVYAQVDHPLLQRHHARAAYAAINIQPGYQKLDGSKRAGLLAFAHRHRPRAEAPPAGFVTRSALSSATKLINNEDRLLSIFAHATSSDIVNRGWRLLRQPLPADRRIDRPSDPPGALPSHARALIRDRHPGADRRDRQPVPQWDGRAHEQLHVRRFCGPCRAGPAQLRAPERRHEGQDQAIVATSAGLPIYYPRLLTSDGFYDGQTRTYSIPDFSNHPHHAYVMVVEAGYIGLGQYYDIQGTTWTSPPILAGPHDTQQIGGRTYQIYFTRASTSARSP